MKIPEPSKLIHTVQGVVKAHLPKLLTWTGICGMVSTTVLAVSATPGAMRKIEAEKRKRDLTRMDIVKLCWRCYLPPIATGLVSAACLICADAEHDRRNAALAAAYSLTETAFKDYKASVVEAIGEKKEEAVRDEAAKTQAARTPISQQQVILTGQGKTLCLDSVSGRYFLSDVERLRRAANQLNYRLRSEMYIPLNEFYDEIELPPIDAGYLLGWNVDWGCIELDFSATLADDQPCLVMSYSVRPKYDFMGR